MKQNHLIAAAAAATVAVLDITYLLYTRRFHYCLHKSSPLDTVLCQLSPLNIFTSCLILFSIYCRTVKWYFCSGYCPKMVSISHFFHACYKPTFSPPSVPSTCHVFFSLHVREKLPLGSQIAFRLTNCL